MKKGTIIRVVDKKGPNRVQPRILWFERGDVVSIEGRAGTDLHGAWADVYLLNQDRPLRIHEDPDRIARAVWPDRVSNMKFDRVPEDWEVMKQDAGAGEEGA